MFLKVRRFLPVALMVTFVFLMLHATAHAAVSAAADDRCGAVELGTPPTGSDEAQARYNCFTSAVGACDPVSLTVSAHTADSIVTRTFITEQGDRGCNVAETVERSHSGHTTTDANVCSGVHREKDAIVFSNCGRDGEIMIPSVASAQAAAAFVKART
ncbi:MAG: hypothetical protein M3Z37_07590 [Candidatus Eremiobacteraeota bacterium]|nr:hypothetical protein [Candidatus Eremiobacteraeota bacterium]